MTMITPSYLGETIEYSSLHACRSTLEDPTAPVRRKVGRNEPCPCGSGKKYKKCHLALDEAASPRVVEGSRQPRARCAGNVDHDGRPQGSPCTVPREDVSCAGDRGTEERTFPARQLAISRFVPRIRSVRRHDYGVPSSRRNHSTTIDDALRSRSSCSMPAAALIYEGNGRP